MLVFPPSSTSVIGSPPGALQCPPGGRSRPSLPGTSVPASYPRLLRVFVKSPFAHTSPPAPSQLSHAVSLLPGTQPPRSFLIHPDHPSPMNICPVPKSRLCPGYRPDAAAPTSHSSFSVSFSPLCSHRRSGFPGHVLGASGHVLHPTTAFSSMLSRHFTEK